RAQDDELLPYDLEATLIHAERLHAAGILTNDELEQLEVRLSLIAISDIETQDEDVHSAIERLLGDLGRKIHPGRSLNDHRGPLAQRPGRGGVPSVRRGRVRGDDLPAWNARRGRAGARRDGGSDADARLHAPAACDTGHARTSLACVGRDARTRP